MDHHIHYHHHYDPPRSPITYPQIWLDKTHTCNVSSGAEMQFDEISPNASYSCDIPNTVEFCGNSITKSRKKLDDGCTVEGHETGQNFIKTHIDVESSYVSLKLFLQGFEEEKLEKKKRKKKKDTRLKDLEAENEELRRKLAEIDEKISN